MFSGIARPSFIGGADVRRVHHRFWLLSDRFGPWVETAANSPFHDPQAPGTRLALETRLRCTLLSTKQTSCVTLGCGRDAGWLSSASRSAVRAARWVTAVPATGWRQRGRAEPPPWLGS